MRALTVQESNQVCGGHDFTSSFNRCMADNWWGDSFKGAIAGGVAGAFAGGGGIFPGAIVGFMSGSTAAFGYCLWEAI